MRKVSKEIGTRENVLGVVAFGVFDNLGEIVSTFGEDAAFKMAQRAFTIDTERVARDGFKAGKTVEEVQALVDAYKPGGVRSSKPTLKTLTAKLLQLGEKARKDKAALECMIKAGQVHQDEGVEAALKFIEDAGF